MTKSQNTKNEQHCIKQNEKSFIQKDLSLTEQWKKGELPSGKYYYISTIYYPEIIQNYVGGFYDLEDDEIEQILAPVPSYDELQNMNKAVNECMAANIKLVEQNAQLKELLKEVKDYLPEFETPMDMLAKIDEVLK